MKVLLIVPDSGLKSSLGSKMYIPLGVAYIAAVLRDSGHEVRLLDANVEGAENLAIRLSDAADFDMVGITVLFNSFSFVEQVSLQIKKSNPTVPIVLGGPLVTSAPEVVIKSTAADIAVLGEGEETIVELVDALSKKGDLSKVKGICFKKGNDVFFTAPRPRIENLNSLPFPAFDLFDLEFYFKSRSSIFGSSQIGPHLSLMTHRGCAHNCKFCLIPQVWPQVFYRSMENVVKELSWQREKFGISGITITDDNFGPSEQRIISFCQNAIANGIVVPFKCLMRASTVIRLHANTLALMKSVGCRVIRIGIESGEENTLQNTAKGLTLQDIERAVKRIKDFGFSADGSFLMIGHPGEEEESLERTIQFVSRLGIKVLAFFAMPLPGTPWYLQAKEGGLIPNEVQFLRELQFWQERPIVNLSKIPDEKLIVSLRAVKTKDD